MRRRFLFGIGLLAFFTGGVVSAFAADMLARPVTAPPPVVAPVSVPEWVGFYIGINGGGGEGHTSFDSSFVSTSPLVPFITSPNLDPRGGIVGGQVGYNWQWGPAVGGLEVDFDAASLDQSKTFVSPFDGSPFSFSTFGSDFKVDELASVRGRLGYLVLPNVLIYGTGGIGYGHFRFSTTGTNGVIGVAETTYGNEFGWVAGAGIEWQVFPRWILRGEYLHYDFGKVTDPSNTSSILGAVTFPLDNGSARTTIDIGRAALSYKF
jgi:outer membrane immunogenic protein